MAHEEAAKRIGKLSQPAFPTMVIASDNAEENALAAAISALGLRLDEFTIANFP